MQGPAVRGRAEACSACCSAWNAAMRQPATPWPLIKRCSNPCANSSQLPSLQLEQSHQLSRCELREQAAPRKNHTLSQTHQAAQRVQLIAGARHCFAQRRLGAHGVAVAAGDLSVFLGQQAFAVLQARGAEGRARGSWWVCNKRLAGECANGSGEMAKAAMPQWQPGRQRSVSTRHQQDAPRVPVGCC